MAGEHAPEREPSGGQPTPAGEAIPARVASEVDAAGPLRPDVPNEVVLASMLDGLQQQIVVATDASALKHLNDQLALAREWARRMRLAFEGQNRFAELELRSARRLGEILRDTVRPGRPAKRSSGSTVSGGMLPDGVTRDRSSKCQKIAAIEAAAFERFIDDCKRQGLLISEGRVLRTLATARSRMPAGKRGGATRARPHDEGPSARIVDAVRRLLTVDVVVGRLREVIEGAEVVPPEALRPAHLRGDLFVAQCPDPGEWLPRLVANRERGAFSQAVVVLPATPGARWFRQLEEGGWTCCFEDDGDALVVYVGPRSHGFWVAFHGIGTVLHGRSYEPGSDDV